MDAIPATPSLADAAPATLFVALELSRSTWLAALHSPIADNVSRHRLDGGDTEGLLALIARKRGQAGASGGEAGSGRARRVLLRGGLRRLVAAPLAVRARRREPGAGRGQPAGGPQGVACQACPRT